MAEIEGLRLRFSSRTARFLSATVIRFLGIGIIISFRTRGFSLVFFF
jgi:hypothetical protein